MSPLQEGFFEVKMVFHGPINPSCTIHLRTNPGLTVLQGQVITGLPRLRQLSWPRLDAASNSFSRRHLGGSKQAYPGRLHHLMDATQLAACVGMHAYGMQGWRWYGCS